MEINKTDTVTIASVNSARGAGTANAPARNEEAAEQQKNAAPGNPAYRVTLSAESQAVSETQQTEAAPPADAAATYNNMGEIAG